MADACTHQGRVSYWPRAERRRELEIRSKMLQGIARRLVSTQSSFGPGFQRVKVAVQRLGISTHVSLFLSLSAHISIFTTLKGEGGFKNESLSYGAPAHTNTFPTFPAFSSFTSPLFTQASFISFPSRSLTLTRLLVSINTDTGVRSGASRRRAAASVKKATCGPKSEKRKAQNMTYALHKLQFLRTGISMLQALGRIRQLCHRLQRKSQPLHTP